MPLTSHVCNENDFRTDWFKAACARLGDLKRFGLEPSYYHRKLWEWCYIYEALRERGMLAAGKRGIGFAVGREPLTAAFAKAGCDIHATDLDLAQEAAHAWNASGQHAASLHALNEQRLCPPEDFARRVTFSPLDMNQIPAEHFGRYDFSWSSCSFEHCGTIELGLRFVRKQMHCLKPGGIAVHTTELNLSSDRHTIARGNTVLFRRSDLARLQDDLRRRGHEVDIHLTVGDGRIESYIDEPPYDPSRHMRLKLEGHVTTSVGMIVQKAAVDSIRPRRSLIQKLGRLVFGR